MSNMYPSMAGIYPTLRHQTGKKMMRNYLCKAKCPKPKISIANFSYN